VTDTTMGSKEVKYEITTGLLVGNMTFDLGWHWAVLFQGQNYSQIFQK